MSHFMTIFNPSPPPKTYLVFNSVQISFSEHGYLHLNEYIFCCIQNSLVHSKICACTYMLVQFEGAWCFCKWSSLIYIYFFASLNSWQLSGHEMPDEAWIQLACLMTHTMQLGLQLGLFIQNLPTSSIRNAVCPIF